MSRNNNLLFQVCLVFFVSAGIINARGIDRTNSGLRSDNEDEVDQIIGGNAVMKGTYRYMAHLKVFSTGIKDGTYSQCGGTVISPKHILTAAHCVVDENGVKAKTVQVYMRVYTIDPMDSTYVLRTVEGADIMPHESYNPDTVNNDIAILKIRVPFEYNVGNTKAISIASLPKADNVQYVVAGATGNVVGWGLTSNDGETSSTMLTTSLIIQSDADCLKKWKNYAGGYDPKTRVCTFARMKASCQGDSGGPLVSNGIQIGIVSYGGEFCEDGNVFTRVSAYLGWLQAKMA